MKFYDKNDSNYNYFKIFLSVFLAITCSIIVYFLFSKMKHIGLFFSKLLGILSPVIVGIIFACLLNPFVKKIEEAFNKKEKISKQNKLGRVLGILITYLVVGVLIYLIFKFLVPSLFDSINIMINILPSYIDKVFAWLRRLCDKYGVSPHFIDEYSTDLNAFIKKSVVPNLDVIINNLALGITSVIKGIINAVVSIIISIYLIYDKETFISGLDRVLKAYCSPKVYNDIISVAKDIYRLFAGFFVAKALDSLIIGVITFILLSIFNIPYTLLISVLVCVTNIIPFFGPFIGAIPSLFLLLMINPAKAIEFGILILIIQQFDGNILGPKMIGNKIGMKSFWVLFAIILFGGLFGFGGILIAVPLFACIYEFVKNKVDKRLKEKESN